MKIDKLSVSYARKFNMGDYNSLSLEATTWADLESSDNPVDCLEVLQEMCRVAVKNEYSRLRKAGGNGQQAQKAQLAEAAEAGNPGAAG